ncbi:MAG: FAD-dependent oxidoreductase, partial [Acidimicrobiia bacterium]|nr:FAD-dependent oxidoreductase [Acidimicrobiia bacterium]
MCDHSDVPELDVLVVGGGPSGAAAAYWLAEHGRRVLVVEKKRFPREKTCGDALTPRAVRQLEDMGLAEPLADYLRFDGLRSIAHGVTLELAWPEHPDFPSYGYVVRRRDLDEMV